MRGLWTRTSLIYATKLAEFEEAELESESIATGIQS